MCTEHFVANSINPVFLLTDKTPNQLECGPMPNVMAAQPNIGGAVCESSVIPFLVPRRKVWQTALLECRAVTLPIWENARLGRKVNFARDKIPSGGRSPRKCIYSAPAQETAKDRVWLTSGERNPLKFAGCPKLPNRSQPLVGQSSPYYQDMQRRY